MSKQFIRLSKVELNIWNQFVHAVNADAVREGASSILLHEEVARRIIMGYVMRQVQSVNDKQVNSGEQPSGESNQAVPEATSEQELESTHSDSSALANS